MSNTKRKTKWTDEQLIEAVFTSKTKSEVYRKLNLYKSSRTWESLIKHILRLDINISHLMNRISKVDGMTRLRETIAIKEGELLSTEFTRLRDYYSIKCKFGHIWKAIGNSIIKGHWCRKCHNISRRPGPNLSRASHLKVYGIDIDIYNKMLEKQNFVCAICNKPETRKRNGAVQSLCVDHDHSSGKVRGLLCFRCNLSLGHLEKYGWLEASQNYLALYV